MLMIHNWCTEFNGNGNGGELYGQGIARWDTTHGDAVNLLGFYYESEVKSNFRLEILGL